MHLIIHCGRAKTGTSSLQSSFRKNYKLLRKHGVLYYTGGLSNHNPLAFLAGKNPRMTEEQRVSYIEQAKHLVHDIKHAIKGGQVPYVLLSAEYMENFTSEQLESLTARFGVPFDTITAIMYIRPPHANYLSRMQQKVKADHLLLEPRKYRDDTLACINRWKRNVGPENLVVRLFVKEKLHEGDVVKDFVSLINERCNLSVPGIPTVHENKSLAAESSIVLQKFRQTCCAEHSRVFLESSNHLMGMLARIEKKGRLHFSKPRLKDTVISEIYQNNRDSIQAVDEQHPHLEFSKYCLKESANPLSEQARDDAAAASTDFTGILADIDHETVSALPYLVLGRTIDENLNRKGKPLFQKDPSSRLKAQVLSLRSQMEALKAECQQVKNSRCWRLTAPFRKTAAAFERWKKKNSKDSHE